MAEEKHGERIAVVEAMLGQHVLPMLRQMDEKLDRIMDEKASKASVDKAFEKLAKIEVALQGKADKAEVREVRDRVLTWTGVFAVLAVLVSWFGKELLAMLAR